MNKVYDRVDFEQIVESIKEKFNDDKDLYFCNFEEILRNNDTFEEMYNKFKEEAIDEYVSKYDYEMEEIVNSYGVFKAIRSYQKEYGEFIIDSGCNFKYYNQLGYLVIEEYMSENNYCEKTKDSIKEDYKNNE